MAAPIDRRIRLRDVIGVDNMLWGNDFPHAESTWPKSREFLDRIFAGTPDGDRRKITADNAAKLFRFSIEEAVLASNATLGGPTTAAGMAVAKGWDGLVLPAILVGVWGYAIGNWLEAEEAIDCLRGKQIPDLLEVTTVLAGTMVWLGGKAASIEEGMRLALSAIWSGAAPGKNFWTISRVWSRKSVCWSQLTEAQLKGGA